MNLLEIGKILRPHGVKGAVKVECFLEDHFSKFKEVMVTNKLAKAEVKNVQNLNNDFYIVILDIIPDIDTAEKFRNQSIYIDRDTYYSDLLRDLTRSTSVKLIDDESINNDIYCRKYGSYGIAYHEAGVVMNGEPYILIIMTQLNEKDYKNEFINDAAALISDLHNLAK